jgi:hypothetical protein
MRRGEARKSREWLAIQGFLLVSYGAVEYPAASAVGRRPGLAEGAGHNVEHLEVACDGCPL